MGKLYRGIDISLYQNITDFSLLKKNGIDFVMIKASQGRTADYSSPFVDPKFEKNISGLIKAKGEIYGGSYHYLCAKNITEALAEADFFVKTIEPYKYNLQLWAAVDVEEEQFLPNEKNALTSVVKAFCDRVESAGYRPMVYSSTWWLNNKFDSPENVPIWEANWSVSKIPNRAKMLQIGTTTVEGVGIVDTNIAYEIIGDANGDGKVNAKDVQAILRSLAGFDEKINESQADIDRDGYVTAKDVKKLLENLSK